MSRPLHSKPTRQRLAWAAATVLTLILLSWLLFKVQPRQVMGALSRGDPWFIGLAALLALGFNTLQSAELYRWTLRGFGLRLPYVEVLLATGGNLAIQGTLPGGTGHMMRVAYLNRKCGAPLAGATAAVVAGLWFKLTWLLVMATAGWALALAPPAVPGPLLAALLAGMLFLTAAASPVTRWLGANTRLPGRAAGAVNAVAESVSDIRGAAMSLGALHALLSVLAEVAIFAVIMHGLGATVDLALTAACFPLVIIVSKLPITIMGMGTREALTVLLFAGAAPPGVLLAGALAFSAVEHLLPTLVGILFTWSYLRRIFTAEAQAGDRQ